MCSEKWNILKSGKMGHSDHCVLKSGKMGHSRQDVQQYGKTIATLLSTKLDHSCLEYILYTFYVSLYLKLLQVIDLLLMVVCSVELEPLRMNKTQYALSTWSETS